MLAQEIIDQAKSKINQAGSIIIAIPPSPGEDILAASLGLFLTLKQAGKNIRIGCSSVPKVGSAKLFGLDQISANIGSQNMLITLDFPEESLEKIDYNAVEAGKKIELHVIPRAGINPLASDQVHINFVGAKADLIIVFAVNRLEELGKLYAKEKVFFDTTPIVSINLKPAPSAFAQISLHTFASSSLSEIVAYFLKQAQIVPQNDPASNLLRLMVHQSNRFASPKTTPESLETAAFLMRQITPPPPPPPSSKQSPFISQQN